MFTSAMRLAALGLAAVVLANTNRPAAAEAVRDAIERETAAIEAE